MFQNGTPGSLRDDALIADEQQMGGAGRQFIGPVSDEQHGQAGAHQPLNDFLKAGARGAVEATERVVENQQLRRAQQGVPGVSGWLWANAKLRS